MRSFLLNKLVRDNIVDIMHGLNQTPQYRVLDEQEYLVELKKKLIEEWSEFDPAKSGAVKELADVLEVIEAIGDALGTNFTELRKLQKQKRAKAGGFGKRLFVGRLDMEDTDPWVDYYAAEPERFTEVNGRDIVGS